jgi:hypothetical protein
MSSEVTPEKILARAKVLHPDMVWNQVCIRSNVFNRKKRDGTISAFEAEQESNLINQLAYIAFKGKLESPRLSKLLEALS